MFYYFIFLPYLLALSLLNSEYKEGMTIRVSNVELIRPPITTIARGDIISEPSEFENPKGANPSIVVKAVINIGFNLSVPALIIASFFERPSSLNCLILVIITIALLTTIPTSIIIPIKVETFKEKPLNISKIIEPMKARGMDIIIIIGSLKD